MRKLTVTLILVAAVAWTSLSKAPAQDANPINVLKSDASLKEKQDACRALSLTGNRDAVPALAALLGDEKLSHMARWALEPMPFPEAGAALRDALGKTTRHLKVGIINSLASRKDEQAVPEMIKSLSDADAAVAQAAADALGMIATPDAAKALQDAITQANVPPANLQAFCDALCACAENLAAKGQRDQAIALYDEVLKAPNAPQQVYAAAFRGAVLVRGPEQGLSLLLEALRADDEHKFAAALGVSRELGNDQKLTAALADVLPKLAPQKKIRLLGVLGERGGTAAGPAALAAAKDGPVEVRLAALSALTRMGYTPALELIAQLARAEDADLAKAARNSLSYFPAKDKEAAVKAMLDNKNAETRSVAVELIGRGALEKPAGLLTKIAETDKDENVRVTALKALQDCAGIEEMPGLLQDLLKARSPSEMQAAESALGALCARQKRLPSSVTINKAVYGNLPDGPSADVLAKVKSILESGSLSIDASNANFGDTAPGVVKKLQIDYIENGTPVSKTVDENQTLKLTGGSAPDAIVDSFCAAYENAKGDPKLALLRLLGTTASRKALQLVQTASASNDASVKETAQRTLCDWPTPEALPLLLDLAKHSPDQTLKVLAMRGAVRFLIPGNLTTVELLANCAALMKCAATPDERKSVLGALAQVPDARAFEMTLSQLNDESVKAEAVQAAVSIAKNLGKSAAEDSTFFNGKDLTGWQGQMEYWKFEDGAIIGHSDKDIPRNEFLWSGVEVRDFYLAVDVQLQPASGNAGIQFRSKKVDEHGQALGYQGDVGQDVWGRLYHEHGRGKLDWTDRADKAVKPGEWNHYEILAVGPAIWTAINGQLGVACLDIGGESAGLIAVQIHAGPPPTVRYRINKLIHNPKLELAGLTAEQLIAELKVPQKP